MPASANAARTRPARPATSMTGNASNATTLMRPPILVVRYSPGRPSEGRPARSRSRRLQLGDGAFDREAIPGAAEPGHGRGHVRRDHRIVAPVLARLGVGDVQLH